KTGGVLHSFDVDARTKNVYSGSGQWEFHLLKNNLERDLQHQVSKIGKVYRWMHVEKLEEHDGEIGFTKAQGEN
ncbi:MAG: hypothetical protein EBW21_06050, partial [Actinobacteria bacterium]|nr:hypothetical protein [Actinomycetota bacterium]